MRVAFAAGRARSMNVDVPIFLRAIATAMEINWMNVAFVVGRVFRMVTATVTEVNWTHWETAGEVALQIWMTTAFVMTSIHALERPTLVASATVQVPSTIAVVLIFHLPTATAMETNWTRLVYAAANVLLIPILTAFVTMLILAWANTTNAVPAMEPDQAPDTIAMGFASKIATQRALATTTKSAVAGLNPAAMKMHRRRKKVGQASDS